MACCEPPQLRYFGDGAVGRIADLLIREHPRRVLLVTGRASYSASGAERALSPMLRDLGVTRFEEFDLNPILPDVERGVRVCRDLRPDIVVAVGGGSVIDMAKAINALSAQGSEPAAILAQPSLIRKRARPLIAVPTTAGTGSEATHFATIYIDAVKHSLAHEWLRPDYAIVDPRLTYTLPSELTAVTGLDALTQAIEAYWAVGATRNSQALAADAIERMWGSLVVAVRTPNPRARSDMAYGAHLSGRAIDVSKTTAAHAISYSLTKRYGVAHGHAVALTVGALFEHNARVRALPVNDPRGAAYVEHTMARLCRCLGCDTPAAVARAWRHLLKSIDLATDLRSAGIGSEAVETILAEVNTDRLGNHPVQVTSADLRSILTNLVRP